MKRNLLNRRLLSNKPDPVMVAAVSKRTRRSTKDDLVCAMGEAVLNVMLDDKPVKVFDARAGKTITYNSISKKGICKVR